MDLITFFVCCTFLFLKSSSTTDPCENYHRLDEPDRSAATVTVLPYLCDSGIDEGWYRSVSGAGPDIPNIPVPPNRCGTQFPIWMNDTLPPIDTQKSVKLCMHHDYFGECSETFNINVKNCGGTFNVYELKQTSGCPMRYCFGTNVKCPDGKSSDTGYGPICEVVPGVSFSLSVAVGLATATYSKLKFDCNFTPIPDNKDRLRYRVEWFIDTNSVVTYSDKTFAELPATYLHEESWVGKYYMGFNVKCTMRARFEDGTMHGNVSESVFFYAGFKAEPSSITLKEGSSTEIAISLTVPIGGLRRDTTLLHIQAEQPQHQKDDETCEQDFEKGSFMFKGLECYVKFYPNSETATKTMKIVGQSDNSINEGHGRNAYLRLRIGKVNDHLAWSYATIPDIKVHVSDNVETAGVMCKSTNDPYIWPFDAKDNTKRFSNQGIGEFVLYKHHVHDIQVNVMNTGCTGGTGASTASGACVCGVVVRHKDNRFTANFCGHISREYIASLPRNRYIERTNCDDEFMTIVPGNDQDYKIILPTGTTVTFDYEKHSSFGWWIPDIIITPSVFDWKQTSGLCGFFDGDASNDFTLTDGRTLSRADFIRNWWIPYDSSESLFNLNNALPPSKESIRQYCKCREGSETTLNCRFEAMEPCTKKQVNSDVVASYFLQCGEKRSKRATLQYGQNRWERDTDEEGNDDSFDKLEITYSSNNSEVSDNNSEWQNGWTEERARLECTESLYNMSFVVICKEILQTFVKYINGAIEDCIDDIRASGGTTFLKNSINGLSKVCILEASKYENLTKSNSSSGNNSTPLLNDILEVSCVNNCSGNGICVKGKCECIDDFHGPRCTKKRTDAPTLEKNINSGLCKTNERSCHSYGIIVENIIEGFFCRARHFKVTMGTGDDKETRVDVSQSPLVFQGTYVNDFSVRCQVPNSRKRRAANPDTVVADGYHISVSNDGVTYSEEITFVNYDSICYDCNSTDIACSLIGEYDTCVPKQDEKPKSSPTTELNVGLIVGTVIAGIFIIGVIVLIIIKKSTQQGRIHESAIDLTQYSESVTSVQDQDTNETCGATASAGPLFQKRRLSTQSGAIF